MTALVAVTRKNLQNLVKGFGKIYEKWKLEMNGAKSKVLRCNRGRSVGGADIVRVDIDAAVSLEAGVCHRV